MAYTNKTANYELPQYVPTDQPTYLEDFNGAMFTIDSGMKENSNNIGDLSSLTTTAKSNLVSAVNEVNANSGVALIGDLSSLTTTEKSTVVGAINEVDSNTDTNTTAIGDLSSLTTTDKSSLVSAINEVASSSGGGGVQIIDVTNNTPQNPIIFDNLDIGEYIIYFNNTTAFLSTKNVYFKNKSTDTSDDYCAITSGSTLKVMKKSNQITNDNDYMGCIECFYVPNNYKLKYDIINIGLTNIGNIEFEKRGNRYILTTGTDTSADKMLRTNSSGNIQWSEFNTIASNYNASAIQYLKNENGTLNWVTEANVTPSMIYLGKINLYNSASNALDLSSYPAGTRIVLKHNDSSRSFYIKVGSNTAQVQVSTDDNTAIVNNIYYVDINSISGATAGISITWASTYEWCPLVTNNIMVNFTQASATVGNTTRSMQVFPYFQIEEDASGNLNTTTLQQFIDVRESGISKTKPQQRTAIQYIDKNKNSFILTYKSHTSGSQQIYEGTGILKSASVNGLYEAYRVTLEINYSGITYVNYQLTKTNLGYVFDPTAITGYSATGTRQLQLNNGALEWV